jgi:hypothetical protein
MDAYLVEKLKHISDLKTISNAIKDISQDNGAISTFLFTMKKENISGIECIAKHGQKLKKVILNIIESHPFSWPKTGCPSLRTQVEVIEKVCSYFKKYYSLT